MGFHFFFYDEPISELSLKIVRQKIQINQMNSSPHKRNSQLCQEQ